MIQPFKRRAKNILLFVLYYSGLLTVLKVLLKAKSPVVRIFSYHNVSDEKMHLFAGVSVKNFRSQMAYLKRYFKIISLDEFVEIVREKPQSFPHNLAVITFDDGYRNNYQHAYPILREDRIPATIFLTTDYIGTHAMLWTDKLNYMFKDTQVDILEVESPPRQFKLGNATEKLAALNYVRDVLKNVDNAKRDELLARISAQLGVSEPVKRKRDTSADQFREMLSWEEIREMQKNSITFGAHTQSHPILTQVPIEQARRQIQDSKAKIEEHLGCQVICFAYPNGLEKDFNEEIIDILQETGFQGAVTNINGFAHPDDDPFELRRINEINRPRHIFAAKVSGIFDKL